MLQPDVRKSVEELKRLLTDDFIEFGSSGRVYTKQQVLEELPMSPELEMTLIDFNAKLLASDVALTTYRVLRRSNDAKDEKYSLRSSLWKLNDGKWQILFHQGTYQKL